MTKRGFSKTTERDHPIFDEGRVHRPSDVMKDDRIGTSTSVFFHKAGVDGSRYQFVVKEDRVDGKDTETHLLLSLKVPLDEGAQLVMDAFHPAFLEAYLSYSELQQVGLIDRVPSIYYSCDGPGIGFQTHYIPLQEGGLAHLDGSGLDAFLDSALDVIERIARVMISFNEDQVLRRGANVRTSRLRGTRIDHQPLELALIKIRSNPELQEVLDCITVSE